MKRIKRSLYLLILYQWQKEAVHQYFWVEFEPCDMWEYMSEWLSQKSCITWLACTLSGSTAESMSDLMLDITSDFVVLINTYNKEF